MIEQNDIKALQAEGKGPAPCARFCEATAFRIEIAGWKHDQAENLANQCGLVDQITALTAERDAAREAVISNCARVMTVTAERDALKDAARLALDAIEELRYSNTTHAADTVSAKAIDALKAVL